MIYEFSLKYFKTYFVTVLLNKDEQAEYVLVGLD